MDAALRESISPNIHSQIDIHVHNYVQRFTSDLSLGVCTYLFSSYQCNQLLGFLSLLIISLKVFYLIHVFTTILYKINND